MIPYIHTYIHIYIYGYVYFVLCANPVGGVTHGKVLQRSLRTKLERSRSTDLEQNDAPDHFHIVV